MGKLPGQDGRKQWLGRRESPARWLFERVGKRRPLERLSAAPVHITGVGGLDESNDDLLDASVCRCVACYRQHDMAAVRECGVHRAPPPWRGDRVDCRGNDQDRHTALDPGSVSRRRIPPVERPAARCALPGGRAVALPGYNVKSDASQEG